MGGEGVPWIGQAPFTEEKHIFANLGDGTYYHRGLLAIRAAVAAKVNITYKILYNDAVAMTGGQPVDGPLDGAEIARQVAAEGVERDRRRHRRAGQVSAVSRSTSGVPVHHRDELDPVQRELREVAGRDGAALRPDLRGGEAPPPQARQVPRSREARRHQRARLRRLRRLRRAVELRVGRAGRDRVRPQAHDRPVVVQQGLFVREGLLPELRHGRGRTAPQAARRSPTAPRIRRRSPSRRCRRSTEPYGILVTGIGGTGVVTIGALLGMAAHLEGKGVSVLDMTGLAQKNGAVVSHVRIARRPEELYATRIAAGEADCVLGCDIVVARRCAKRVEDAGRPHAAGHQQRRGADGRVHAQPRPGSSRAADGAEIKDAVGAGDAEFLDATKLATALMGDSIATNLFMVGYAYQRGLIPVSARRDQARDRAERRRGRVQPRRSPGAASPRIDPAQVGSVATPADGSRLAAPLALARRDDRAPRRVPHRLPGRRVRAALPRARRPRARRSKTDRGLGTKLTEAVARYYFKLLAIKDEYEVARLYTETDFTQRLAAQFEGDYTLKFHLAPPIFAKPDPVTGEPRKREYGPWMMKAFGVLAKLKGLRGTALDVFGRTAERRMERELIAEYDADGRGAARDARAARTTQPPSSSRASRSRSAATAT